MPASTTFPGEAGALGPVDHLLSEGGHIGVYLRLTNTSGSCVQTALI